MAARWRMTIGILAAAAVGAWLLWPAPRARRPARPAEISSVVELQEWKIDDVAITGETTVRLTARSNFQCAGRFNTDAKAWSNVAFTQPRPNPAKGYTKPFLHVEYRFVEADGDGVKVAARGPLNHSRSNRGECNFKGPTRPPLVPGEYELQLVVGVEPAEAPFYDGLPYTYHVLARCPADIASPN